MEFSADPQCDAWFMMEKFSHMTYVLNGIQHCDEKFPIATRSFSLFYMNKLSDFFHFALQVLPTRLDPATAMWKGGAVQTLHLAKLKDM